MASEPQPAPRRKRSKKRLVLFALVPIFLLFVAAEITLRLTVPYITGLTARILWDDPSVAAPDPKVWPPVYPKNARGRMVGIEFDVAFNCNSDGFRGEEFDASRSPIVVCLGDSVTVGYCNEYEKSFPMLLQAALRKRFPNAQVWGMGREGATAVTEIRSLERIFAQYPQADIRAVVLMANISRQRGAGNDLIDQVGLMQYLKEGAPPKVEVPMPALGYLTLVIRETAVLHAGEILIARWRRERLKLGAVPEWDTRLREYGQCLERARDICVQRRCKLVVGLLNAVPSETAAEVDSVAAELRNLVEPMGVPLVNCAAQCNGLSGQLWFFPIDGHPNEKAHAMIARKLEEPVVQAVGGK